MARLAEPGTRPDQANCPIESALAQPGWSQLVSQAEPILVMSQFVGSAWLKMAQLGWLSHFEPSRGITSCALQATPYLPPDMS